MSGLISFVGGLVLSGISVTQVSFSCLSEQT
jgi:hypothetical protein